MPVFPHRHGNTLGSTNLESSPAKLANFRQELFPFIIFLPYTAFAVPFDKAVIKVFATFRILRVLLLIPTGQPDYDNNVIIENKSTFNALFDWFFYVTTFQNVGTYTKNSRPRSQSRIKILSLDLYQWWCKLWTYLCESGWIKCSSWYRKLEWQIMENSVLLIRRSGRMEPSIQMERKWNFNPFPFACLSLSPVELTTPIKRLFIDAEGLFPLAWMIRVKSHHLHIRVTYR